MRRFIAFLSLVLALVAVAAPPANAGSKTAWQPASSSSWYVGSGADNYRTGYNPTEKRPAFYNGGHLGTGDVDGPWLEWQTKLSDLPSGIFPGAGIVVDRGKVFVSGGATNSFLALDATTGLPVWRFSPDQRVDSYDAQYPSSNAPTVHDGIVYASFANGFLYALDENDGHKLWSYQATDKWNGGPPPPGEPDSTHQDSKGAGPFDPVHAPVAYPKIHGVTAYCDGKVFFMTLSGYLYGLNAKTGGLLFKPKYVDNPDFPGELTWWEYKRGGALKVENKSVGSSTRRFEAVPGVGCLHGEVTVLASDGIIRFYDATTGAFDGEYNRIDDNGTPNDPSDDTNFCQAAGWNCDAAIGQADPVTGDYLITTLNARLVRLKWDSHQSLWRRSYNAPLPFQVGSGSTGTLPVSVPHVDEGFIMESVGGGPMAEDVPNQVLYVGNQDGHVYGVDLVNRGGGLRPNDPLSPTLLSYTGVSPNNDPRTPYTRKGVGGPWDYNQHALGSLVLGGGVLYVPTWDNKITAFRVPTNPRDPSRPRLTPVWRYEVKTDPTFQYPPFGDTFAGKYFPENANQPFSDLDNKIFSGFALLNGHLYLSANDGNVYCFNLMRPVKTVRNLVVLGSGLVPFLPKWTQALGAFDRVWTPADWYKNQVAPAGYRLPKPAGVATAATFAWLAAGMWWWLRRRDESQLELEPDP